MKRVLVAVIFLLTLVAYAPQSEAQVWQRNGSQNHQTWRDQHRRHEVRQQRRRVWRHERRDDRWRHHRREHRRDQWRWRHNHRRW
jgi:hypothetical protein